MEEQQNSMKLVIVGDGAVGKTCLLTRYRLNTFPEDYVPTVFENFVEQVSYKKGHINLQMWDTAGQEDFDRIRNRAYPDTDVFLICYAVDDQNSFENIEVKWISEVTHFCKEAKVVLVATKSDRRKDKSTDCISTAKGEELKTKIGAAAFCECSAKTGSNVKETFKVAIDVVRGRAEEKEKTSKEGCVVV
ncbi:Rho family GTPase [Entamoeba histolytica]|uniref:small monomeric GTPase n=6 Tax=Entamoeba histolytica TaxID=5759 RepID=C4M855_ENTH1|nr:Rho family GTPase [Entamoeba histolytica HM-1:IMSS]EAL49965.2 Rho family GTPase [Entamoeba histolytica HM-1:IMSS]EMD43036.1 Rho family GTPase, putative [Entamoeba histolytica KU27]GAT97746.1 Rho family GTPase [Entamoeba histolytica]|eukprot:XP_655351.2 Rho family GTPase [Entamoeba histolytica HM-1:IMSS]